VCFSFDDGLAPTMANEGAVPLDASVTSASATPGQDYGAVKLDTTSRIFIAETADVTGIVALEAWFRLDVAPDTGQRMGLLDSEGKPDMSMFYFRVDSLHLVRCQIGGQELYAPVTPAVDRWSYVTCVCANGGLQAYDNGKLVHEQAGSCAAAGIGKGGVAIGQANKPGAGGDVGDWLVGAIDAIRMWDVPLSAQDICASAGRADC
jgi:hypothetical protein